MSTLFIIGIIVIIMTFISWAWVQGIDRAMRDFPDYRGEDLLDEVPRKKEQVKKPESPEWEQDGHHTKQKL